MRWWGWWCRRHWCWRRGRWRGRGALALQEVPPGIPLCLRGCFIDPVSDMVCPQFLAHPVDRFPGGVVENARTRDRLVRTIRKSRFNSCCIPLPCQCCTGMIGERLQGLNRGTVQPRIRVRPVDRETVTRPSVNTVEPTGSEIRTGSPDELVTGKANRIACTDIRETQCTRYQRPVLTACCRGENKGNGTFADLQGTCR